MFHNNLVVLNLDRLVTQLPIYTIVMKLLFVARGSVHVNFGNFQNPVGIIAMTLRFAFAIDVGPLLHCRHD